METEFIQGEAVTPDHTVTLGGRTLVEGRDYRADYSNNVNVTDSAVLTITGMGNYSGSTTARFKISARNLADADITVASARIHQEIHLHLQLQFHLAEQLLWRTETLQFHTVTM